MLTLGIETSCDETAVALFDNKKGLLGHSLHSQIALHAEYGGVVPELASRDHLRKLAPMVRQLLDDHALERPDVLAYTQGPGLVGALLVGASVAAGLGMGWALPVVGVHHMEGHLLSPLLEDDAPEFPFLALLVSGGHTLLVDVQAVGDYRLLGRSIDDAVGEAFDKTAKLLGLPYPGGPALAALAEQGESGRFTFPRPMLDRPGLDFSFSGLKTAVLTTVRRLEVLGEQDKADIAHGFEEAVADTLVRKCDRAIKQTGAPGLVVAGGVGANKRLRSELGKMATKRGIHLHFPRPEFCTDNAAMIAHVGSLRAAEAQPSPVAALARARWPLDELRPPSVFA